MSILRGRTFVCQLLLTLIAGLIAANSASADSLDGWWISDGYGTLLEIKGDQIKASQITAMSCGRGTNVQGPRGPWRGKTIRRCRLLSTSCLGEHKGDAPPGD